MERSISAILILLAIFRVRLHSRFFLSPFFNEKLFSTLWIYILIRIFSNIHYVTLHSDIIVRFHLISCSFTCFKYAILPESSVRLKSVLFLRFRKLIFYLPSCWITVHSWTWLGELRHGALLDRVDAMPTLTQLKQFGCRSSDGFDPMCLTPASRI